MRLYALFSSILLASSALAKTGLYPRADPTGSSVAPPLPPTGEPPSPGGSSSTGTAPAPVVSSSPGGGPKCGKGYTYCGYMLTSSGHNFAPNDVSKAYCSGLQELCVNGKPKTDVSQAVFVCMNEQPSSVELLCACSGKCRNDAESNYIAHCDKPCINN
ncbi:uncharacterized protein GGS25DRAFT_521360 [Hypoxylon fragiforme]|uniref:uncharacterized protein n=1 Tax=Hypoxylon fragiforme TaxID=63214 RepID=UPI0020C6A95A|nr:uncharacterized protein GGS25DRAFT_521360 [Hypoxylon fragiforme]KAI2608188.1 hypothetical protein GGS25DRAFT_521360 [Hypoxylon fragiforme]